MVSEEKTMYTRRCPTKQTEEEFFWSCSLSQENGCRIWTRGTRDGYGRFSENGKLVTSSNYAWRKTFGNIPFGKYVLHKCDNPLCVEPTHLFLGTKQENMQDRNAKGRQASGERHAFAKLSQKQVEEIRSLYKEKGGRPKQPGNFSCKVLASMFGVSDNQISKILRGINWKAQTA